MDPESGRYAPARIFMSVLLPAPFSPMSARTSPDSTPSETPSSALVAPNDLVTSRISRSTAASHTDSLRASRQHSRPVQRSQHAECARLVAAKNPVDLPTIPRYQALGLLLRGIGSWAGILRVR